MFDSKVLNIIKEIKSNYIKEFGLIDYIYKDGETCLKRWVNELSQVKYYYFSDIFQYIQTSQKDNLVLVRYGRYSDVFGGESEVDYKEFWDQFDGFYRECRSIVIDAENEEIVILPFDKFFNLNENDETSLDNIKKRIENAKSVEISDKLDGSMQCARYYKDKIIMSGSQAIDPDNSWRLADGLKMLNSNSNYIEAVKEHSDLTFIFEYISLADAHVVNYGKDEEGLYLIGLRNVIDGKQYPYKDVKEIALKYNLKTTKIFDKKLDEVINNLNDKKSNEAEGFVLNIDGFFVKIKYNDYVGVSKILSNISSINLIIKNIGDDTFDDLLSKVPESYKWRILKIANIVFEYNKEMNLKVNELYNIVKDFPLKEAMIYINNNFDKKYRGFVISKYKGKNDINFIKTKENCYIKLKDINPKYLNYNELFNVND